LAQKPTIYKQRIAVSDLQRNYYDTLSLTIALHPSETEQRLMARVLAYVINAQQGLSFTKGLSSVEEPDIWVRELDQQISLWVDIGEPAVDRSKKHRDNLSRPESIALIQSLKLGGNNAKLK